MDRTKNYLAKLDWMNKVLSNEVPDRVTISDFFLGEFYQALAGRT